MTRTSSRWTWCPYSWIQWRIFASAACRRRSCWPSATRWMTQASSSACFRKASWVLGTVHNFMCKRLTGRYHTGTYWRHPTRTPEAPMQAHCQSLPTHLSSMQLLFTLHGPCCRAPQAWSGQVSPMWTHNERSHVIGLFVFVSRIPVNLGSLLGSPLYAVYRRPLILEWP